MSKIEVCHIVSGLKAGGVESMIYNYCKELDPKKYSFHLLYQHEPSQKNVDEFLKLGFKLHQIPSKIKKPFKNYYETKKYLKNHNINIVHCHMTLMNFIPLLAAKKLGIKKRICHSHNNDVRSKNVIFKLIEKIIKKMCIFLATDLVACGSDAGKYMYGKREYTVLNNALILDKFKYSEDNRIKIRNKYKIKNNEILIGHIGRFTKQKNHIFLINIIERIVKENKHNYKLMLIGNGELKEEIDKLIIEKHLEEYVICTDIVDNTNEFYSAFDIFILPSLWEGLPVVALEAQVSNLKCIFSENIDQRSKIIDSTIFLKIDDEKYWVERILNNDYNYKRIYDKKAYENQHLDIKKEVQKLVELYRIEGE